MRFVMLLASAIAVMAHSTSAKGYSTGGSRVGGGRLGGGGGSGYGGGSGVGGGFGGSSGVGANVKPTPYNMGYEAPDEEGNVHFRQEEGDGNGNVRGSYGYRDIQGLYRTVQYTSGPAGFQAAIRTNEPGTDGKENPADVQMMVEQTPYGIQEQYARQSGMGGGYKQGGFGGGMGGYNSAGGFGGSAIFSEGYSQGGQGAKSGKSGY